jgi:sugar phosphate permease
MRLRGDAIFYGWWVTFGCAIVVFGVAGGQFSFGVFLKPMTEEFEWSRATLSLAFAVTYMISGLLRPLAGYLADRYSPKWVALSGVLIMGWMLLLIPAVVSNLLHLYLLFAVMSIGVTLGTGPILTKIVSQWFVSNRGVTLGLVGGAGSLGAMILVPATSVVQVAFTWREAYFFLGLFLIFVVLIVGILLIRNRPEDMGLTALGSGDRASGPAGSRNASSSAAVERQNFTFSEAVRTSFFQKLTFGYFV